MDEQLRTAVAGALGRIPSGLFVVSAREGDLETAFLGSWIIQAGFDPPVVSMAVGLDRPARPLVEPIGGRFAISVIAHADRGVLGRWARGVEPGPMALDAMEVERTPAGLGVVPDCLAWLECRTTASVAAGDHLVVLGEVTAARSGRTDDPAVHVRTDGLRY